MKSWGVVFAAALVIALPFIFKKPPSAGAWKEGDPVLVVISPHNEAIRFELASGFSHWHEKNYGAPVKIDWRTIGGTTEIVRYLDGETQASFRGWWRNQGKEWPEGATLALTDRHFDEEGASPELLAVRETLRKTDDPSTFSTGIDLFFGGGEYDHSKVYRQGLTVNPWPAGLPGGLFETADGHTLIPESLSGERWRGTGFVGTALSTFGIVYNADRLADLGVAEAPQTWEDLGDPVYAGQLGVADPTKSGSIAKAFEMIIHQQCHIAVDKAGFSKAQIEAFEQDLTLAPPEYQAAIEAGWAKGLRLVQRIGANARYFTDSAGKVPIDVSAGDAAVGLAIDFYGRYQAETSRGPNGEERMFYVTPTGGSSVSCDPISLLRSAPHRELAVRFIEYTLSIEGQRLWNARPGTPGGTHKFALRRLPIRRDLYPSDLPEFQRVYEETASANVDDLSDPGVNPYVLAESFSYHYRWTGSHFTIHRQLIRAMCLDAGEELRAAWAAIREAGGPEAVPEAMEALQALPPGFTWTSALGPDYERGNEMEVMRKWVLYFRAQYEKARQLAEEAHA
ncbi:ABC transporter substrate-binding protein [Kiritimatiellaeota bacterium B1221]|nr:ABC transporter substrate-binding protein [Kiritimatiellaeota bacterium B1221]